MWLDTNGDYPFVADVPADCPASRAGVEAGDVITRIDGVDVQGRCLLEIIGRITFARKPRRDIVLDRQGVRRIVELDVENQELAAPRNAPGTGTARVNTTGSR